MIIIVIYMKMFDKITPSKHNPDYELIKKIQILLILSYNILIYLKYIKHKIMYYLIRNNML